MMEAPAIIIGVLLMKRFGNDERKEGDPAPQSIRQTIYHSLTNGSVLMLLGSLMIGLMANESQAAGIKPFTTDLFKGFLALFLLDMGVTSGKHLGVVFKTGVFPFLFAGLMPFVNGFLALMLSFQITDSPGNQLLFAILGASASYIAVPAAMKQAIPRANPSLYLPMALGITFPINVMIGIPFYYFLIQYMGA